MSYQIRAFTEDGIRKFEDCLIDFQFQKKIDTIKLSEILFDENITSEIDLNVLVEVPTDTKKYSVAKYLSELIDLKHNRQLYRDRGMWTWLSAFMLEILVPIKKNGERDFREKALYVLESERWNRYYRHLLAFSTLTYAELLQKGKIFLRGNIYERGEIVEQLAAVYNIQRNKSIIEAATIMFYDPTNDTIVKGAANKTKGGTARRFREVLKQFQMTFDLNAMNGNQIVGILPFEFDKWKKAS
jgi:hypothetical protein